MMMEDDMIIYNDNKCTIEKDDVWNAWADLKCQHMPTNQNGIDGGLFPDTE